MVQLWFVCNFGFVDVGSSPPQALYKRFCMPFIFVCPFFSVLFFCVRCCVFDKSAPLISTKSGVYFYTCEVLFIIGPKTLVCYGMYMLFASSVRCWGACSVSPCPGTSRRRTLYTVAICYNISTSVNKDRCCWHAYFCPLVFKK